ncbi:MAG TPA: amidohydrolase [Thermoanaerobaculia bacterium]|nr:amidohydrolase [Thermoanaerobaculia bacterium]
MPLRIALLLLLFVMPRCGSLSPGHAELIVHNGVIWTADAGRPTAEAAAIAEGRFVAVGRDSEVLRLRGPATRMIDLGGAFVVPGFSDNHTHFASAARFLEFNVMTAGTQEELVEKVRGLVADLPPGEWIVGGYWGAYDQWARGSPGGARREPFTPDMQQIEALTRDHPVFIRKFDDSEFAANSAALRAAGVDPANPSASGVEFAGNGILRGPGVPALFRDAVPRSFSRERRVRQTRNALAEIRKHGVTTISDMSDDEQLEIFRALHREGELTVRVHFRYPLERWGELAARGIRVGSGDAWIRLGALKGHIDGIMGNSTARFFQPYDHDPSNRGRWRPLMVDERGEVVEGKFLQFMLDADAAGLQLTVHAIGDEANHVLLNHLEELHRRNGARDRRFRLVHAQVLAPADFPRLGRLGAIAEVQPFHLSDDMRWMEERIGNRRSRGAYAFRSIASSGAMLTFGSDWPGTSAAEYPINPMLGLYAAVARQTIAGEPPGGWFPEQRMRIEEALRAYTWNSAYANFEERERGSIEVGKLADLAVLSRNLLEISAREILDTEVLHTIIDGRVVYSREERAGR